MAPSRHTRKSRRLSRKSPVEPADYDWQGAASLQLLHSGSDVEASPSATNAPPSPPTPSAPSDSAPAIVTHLPFTPGSSHTRNRGDNHVPRPPNAFMIFRSWLWNTDNLKSIERDNRNVSRIAGRYWNELSDVERAPFRRMAEDAKRIHAKLHPTYRYSPGSQKKPKVAQRRPQRNTTAETERCKKVADLLLGGVNGRDLVKYLVDEKKVKPEEAATLVPSVEESSLGAAPRNALKRPAAPRGESVPTQPRSKKPRSLPAPSTTSQYVAPAPTTERASSLVTAPAFHTPQLACPADDVQEFVATDDIPHLSLDNYNDMMLNEKHSHDAFTPFPPHLEPGAHTMFSAVAAKPETSSFADPWFGAYTTDVPTLTTFTEFDVEPYPSLVPLGSPVFSNPFESSTPSAEHSALLGTLDQLFGQPISPLTVNFPTDNE